MTDWLSIVAVLAVAGCRQESYETPPPKPPAGSGPTASMPAARPTSGPAGLTAPVAMDPHSGMMMPPGHPPIGENPAVAPEPAPGRTLRFTAPAAWKEESPGSSMRLAQYRIPRADGDAEDGVLAVSSFPGMKGKTQMNIERWISQFSQPDSRPSKEVAKTTTFEVSGMPTTVLSISGTFGEHKSYRMLAAVIDTPDGPWFVKLTGPEKTIEAQDRDFDAFVRSAHY